MVVPEQLDGLYFFVMENQKIKWMIWGCLHFRKPPYQKMILPYATNVYFLSSILHNYI